MLKMRTEMQGRKATTIGRKASGLIVACTLVAMLLLVCFAASCRWTTPNQGAGESETVAAAEPASTGAPNDAGGAVAESAPPVSPAASEPSVPAAVPETAPAPVPTPAATSAGLICLDPGHADTAYEIDAETGLNTSDWANEPEIEIVWDIATRAAAILRARGVDVVLTKSSCYDPVSLKQRAAIANASGASLIVHIHTDTGISAPTTFYPGAAPYNWKANSDSGRTAYISSEVQQASQAWASVFHTAMAAYLAGSLGVGDGGLAMENRGSTGTGNYGPLLSYDVWSWIPTFTLENSQSFADSHRQAVAQSIAEGVIACLNDG